MLNTVDNILKIMKPGEVFYLSQDSGRIHEFIATINELNSTISKSGKDLVVMYLPHNFSKSAVVERVINIIKKRLIIKIQNLKNIKLYRNK